MTHPIRKASLAVAALLAMPAAAVHAQAQAVVLNRDGSTIVFEPYAPNIIRVTLSLIKEQATAAPGYGFVAHPSAQGWSRQGDVYRSPRLAVTLEIYTHEDRQAQRDALGRISDALGHRDGAGSE